MFKRLLIILISFFAFCHVSYAVEQVIGTLPKQPSYTITKLDRTGNLYYIRNPSISTGAYGTVKIYDNSGVLLTSYTDNCATVSPGIVDFAIESKENLFIFDRCSKNASGFWGYNVFIYNYIEDLYIYINSGNSTSQTSFAILKDGTNLIFSANGTGNISGIGIFSYDISSTTLIGAYSRVVYTGSRVLGNLEPVTFSEYYWSKNDDQLIYLNSGNKSLEYVVIDQVGDIIRFNDVFVSTWAFSSFNLIIDNDLDAHLGIYGSSLEMRGYENYFIGTIDFIIDDYFLTYIGTDLVTINPSDVMLVDYTTNTYNMNLSILDLGVGNTMYWVNSLNQIVKDSDIVINFTSTINGGTGGTGTGGTIITGTGVLDDSIRNFDQNGDGEVGLLNGEIFVGLGILFKAFFNSIVNFFSGLKDFFGKLMEIGTSESKVLGTFIIDQFTINQTHAYLSTTLGSAELTGDNFVTNMYNFIKYFILFILLIMVLLLTILIKKGGSNSSNNTKTLSDNKK